MITPQQSQISPDPQPQSVNPPAVKSIPAANRVNTIAYILLFILIAVEVGRLVLPIPVIESMTQLFYQYIVRTNYIVVNPSDVHSDKVVVQKIVLQKPGFMAVRAYNECCEGDGYLAGFSRYFSAGEFYTVTIVFDNRNTNNELIHPDLTAGKKLTMELYEDNGDGVLNFNEDKRVLDWSRKPVKTNIIVRQE